jgi:hypothetical protein
MLILFLTSISVGCASSAELTRAKAKAIIEADKNFAHRPAAQSTWQDYKVWGDYNHTKPPSFQLLSGEEPPSFRISAAQVQRGIQEGYWVHRVNVYRVDSFSLTDKGGQYFQAIGIHGDGGDGGMVNFRHSPLQPYIVRITGILDNGGKQKFVKYEFNWKLDTIAPGPIKDFLKDSPPYATAVRLDFYDDGLRVGGWNQSTP